MRLIPMRFAMRQFVTAVLTAMIAANAMAANDGLLTIGSPAPPIRFLKWLKGTPVTSIEANRVYVFEFWATWCGDCTAAAPHLSELARRYAGRVTFVGIDSFEQIPQEAALVPKVAKFANQMGDKMDYPLAIDGVDNFMGKAWLDAAKTFWIPTAVVVDRTKSVAWIGDPTKGLDEAIEQILAGNYDLTAARTKWERQQAATADAAKAAKAKTDPFMLPYNAGHYREAVAALDKAFAADPKIEHSYGAMRFQCLATYDPAKAAEYAQKLLSRDPKDSITAYVLGASLLTEQVPVKDSHHRFAISLLQEAIDRAGPARGIRSLALNQLALAFAKESNYERAVALEKQAIESFGDPKPPADNFADAWKLTLAEYEKKLRPAK